MDGLIILISFVSFILFLAIAHYVQRAVQELTNINSTLNIMHKIIFKMLEKFQDVEIR